MSKDYSEEILRDKKKRDEYEHFRKTLENQCFDIAPQDDMINGDKYYKDYETKFANPYGLSDPIIDYDYKTKPFTPILCNNRKKRWIRIQLFHATEFIMKQFNAHWNDKTESIEYLDYSGNYAIKQHLTNLCSETAHAILYPKISTK